MTDKPSERVSGRPPMPSIAPPTDDIDSEWGADDIPAPARVPQVAQPAPSPSAPPRAASVPAPAPVTTAAAPRPSSSPAPRPSTSPAPRPSSTSASSTPLVAASNPLRKQTLLGIAPVIPRSEPAAAAPSQPPSDATSTPLVTPSRPPSDATATPLIAASNPLRKQTLLGIAPVVPPEPKTATSTETAISDETATSAEAAVVAHAGDVAAAGITETTASSALDPASSVPSLVAQPAAVATDAPTTSDLPEPEPTARPRRHEPVRAAVDLSSSQDELPALKSTRPRWVLPAAAAAIIALGVAGLRSLDRAPSQLPEELAHPHKPGKASSKAFGVAPKDDDDGDDDDDNGPKTGSDDAPDPTPPEPEPLKAKGADAAAAAAPASAAAPPSAASADAPKTPATGDVVRVNVDSDPPGARLFWKGKEVGTTPFVLPLQPGEKHAYELGLPGYTTRKVVIDGSKTDISIGLRPDPSATPGASSRK